MGDSLPSLMPRTRPSEGAGRIDRVAWTRGHVRRGPRRAARRSDQRARDPRAARELPAPGLAAQPLAPLVDELFSVWVDPADAATRPSRVYVGARRRARTRDLRQAFAVLESELRQSLAARSRQRTFVHAGVVGLAREGDRRAGPQPQRKDDARGRAGPRGRLVPLGRVRGHRRARPGSPVRQAALDPRGGGLRPSRQPAERRGPGRTERHPSRSRSAWWCSPPTSPGPSGGRRRSRRARP